MPTDTTEAALEACIERFLTGDFSTPGSNHGRAQEASATYETGEGVGSLGINLIAQAVTGRIKI